ncbi:MAG: shikimate dehydrogenase [Gemmatimonadales bacterium]|nr:shikimate dehydrogenase [Gemmatimonadales bacterium]MYG48432.1 shikimate dehydrogenase [Gemmatimonadales bacterium]MYK00354.1 shikimate dehydrogenase [Candidatus Palauibacter ramosifaciens]
MTLRFALLGDPVRHSISPAMHLAAFEVLGLDAEYIARRTAPGEVGPVMRRADLAGGNVTLPHKPRAARALARPSAAVRATGACNCWWRRPDGELAGDNTDIGGLDIAFSRIGFRPRRARVLLLGAGGAARAAVHALLRGGVSSIEVLNRTPARAQALRDRALAQAVGADQAADAELSADANRAADAVRVVAAPQPGAAYDLVLNSTSLGLAPGDSLPLDLDGDADRARFGAAFDMVYAAGETAWVRHARALGVPAAGGLDMLVGQAALSLERWFPGHAAPFDVMREAAVAELARRTESEPRAGPGAE